MSQPQISRREALELPSRGKHFALAFLVFALIAALPFLLVAGFGDADDARTNGEVKITPLPILEASTALNDPDMDTPDLLAGEVPDGVNPTDEIAAQQAANAAPKTDALGNPIGAGQNNTAASPKLIKIDGQAIGASALPAAPLPGLTQNSAFGPIPARAADGGTALTRYNRPFKTASGKRPVSVIIGGLGVNGTLTQRAIDDLPADVTLSFAAHASGLQNWINLARADGHEVIIEIPMESAGFDASEPGADRAMRLSKTAQENHRNLDWMLSRAQGYWGVTNYNGDAFLRRADAIAPILDRLSQTGLGFVTDGAFTAPTLPALSQSVNLPYKAGFGLIDPDPNTALINARLSNLASTAKTQAHPIGVGFAYPETIEAVSAWSTTLDAQGLILAPASAALIK